MGEPRDSLVRNLFPTSHPFDRIRNYSASFSIGSKSVMLVDFPGWL